MAFEPSGDGGLEYRPCRYGTSKIPFRGPRKCLDGQHVAVLGGTRTFGKYVAEPYPELLEQALGRTCVNFGCVNAGIDAFAGDETVVDACRDASLTILEVPDAGNMSNRLYIVHPRRNDRFVAAKPALRTVFPDVDFTEINFTRHLLRELHRADPARFEIVREELRLAWTARLQRFCRQVGGRVVLLWMDDRRPEDRVADAEPPFVDRAMLDAAAGEVLETVEVVAPRPFAETGTAGMIVPPLQEAAARSLPGPDFHQAVADALLPTVKRHHRARPPRQ